MTIRPVLAIGETMVMVAPEVAQPLEEAVAFRLDVGGAESNVASHLAGAGVPAAWAGAVGDDALGRRLVATLADRGVDVSLVRVDPHAPTGVYFKDPGAEGTRVLYYRSGSAASRLGPAFAAELPLREAPLVHLSGITPALSGSCRALVEEIIAVRRTHGLPVSFDVNYRPALWDPENAAPVLLDLARRCDVVFVGRDEAAVLWGTTTADEVRALVGHPGTLVVKDGAVGAHAFRGDATAHAPAGRVTVVEPVGAGDAFAAGYLSAMLAGSPATDALARGHRFAAAVLATTMDF
jgi:2-dehydro-3-deoxygluconokinase